jgi:hypothetical protein
MSLDERLETYVWQHDIVDIEFDQAEYNEDDNIDDSDKDEGVDIDENAFPELNSEENDVQLVNQYSKDGLGNTCMHDNDRDDNSINEVLVVNPPPVVVDPPPVYCQITSNSPPPVDNEPTEPMMFHVREYSSFTVQEAWDHGNIAQYHQPLVGTCDEF